MALRIKYILAYSVAAVALPGIAAAAQTRMINVPAEDAVQSIPEFARQENIQIIAPAGELHGIRTQAVSGAVDMKVALSALISGTGLEVANKTGSTIILRRASAATPTDVDSTAAPSPTPSGAGDQAVEQVVVSSTRLQNAGFEAPTPTTVVSALDLQKNAQPNVFDAITQLPALQGSTGGSYNTATTTTGLQGLSALGLRGLSPLRTLVLLDSQRVVGANFNGVVDVSQMPQMLIQRVDVVTGGASASWGSDAVAGIVNFVTEKKFEGFKANILGGESTYGDDGNATVQVAAGTSFLDGRAHIEAAGEYSYTAGVQPSYPTNSVFGVTPNINGRNVQSTEGIGAYSSINATPAGQPQYNFGTLTQQTSYASFGLVTNGPKIGTTFGAAGTAVPYQYAGNCTTTITATSGTLNGAIGGLCFGTPTNPGDQVDAHQNDKSLVDPLTRGNIYIRTSYDLSPNTEIYATANISMVRSENISADGTTGRTGLNFSCGNAYLPATNLFGTGLSGAATQAACLTAYPSGNLSFATYGGNLQTDWQAYLQRDQRRFVVGGDGSFNVFGTDWSWSSYFEHGETDAGIKLRDIPITARLTQALNAVSAGTASPVCGNVTAQANGCVPYNPFGQVPASPGTVAYIENQTVSGTSGPSAVQTQRQEAFSFSVNGAPFDDWAGKVAVALGVDYREEAYTQRGDPYGAGISGSTPATAAEPCTDPAIDCINGNNWLAGNFHNGEGSYHVSEAFLETGIPLFNDEFWGKADLDLAGRVEAYSTSGQANTWKVGATWDTPLPGVRVRALQSRDVRAPNLSELFSPTQGLSGSVNNDFSGVAGQTVRQLNEGNNQLKPERSQTTELGLVYSPEWLEGFQTSVDYYRINVQGVVSALTLQQVEDLCFYGNATYCQQGTITTANGVNQSVANTGAVGSTNQLSSIASKAFNQAGLLTAGFDFESSYQFDLQNWGVPGGFVLRSLVNNVTKFISNAGVIGQAANVELAGVLAGGNNSQTYNQSGGNVLTWKVYETQSYQTDQWGVTLTERWDAGGTIEPKNYIVCAPGVCPAPTIQNPTINYDKVDSAFYLDVGANWNVSSQFQLYTKIDNITNLSPPAVGANYGNNALYDVIGRMYRVGVRFNY